METTHLHEHIAILGVLHQLFCPELNWKLHFFNNVNELISVWTSGFLKLLVHLTNNSNSLTNEIQYLQCTQHTCLISMYPCSCGHNRQTVISPATGLRDFHVSITRMDIRPFYFISKKLFLFTVIHNMFFWWILDKQVQQQPVCFRRQYSNVSIASKVLRLQSR